MPDMKREGNNDGEERWKLRSSSNRWRLERRKEEQAEEEDEKEAEAEEEESEKEALHRQASISDLYFRGRWKAGVEREVRRMGMRETTGEVGVLFM
jgi:hypothetical protein